MKTIKQTEKDRFIQIAAGGKKMNGEVKRMAEIPPLPLTRVALNPVSGSLNVTAPAFDEGKEYQAFLEEKRRLRAYYAPYLENHARKVTRKEYSVIDFSYRKETEEDKECLQIAAQV